MTQSTTPDFPVVVIGAGPVGLAAAVHLVAKGTTPLILEAGVRDAEAKAVGLAGCV